MNATDLSGNVCNNENNFTSLANPHPCTGHHKGDTLVALPPRRMLAALLYLMPNQESEPSSLPIVHTPLS